MEEIVVNSLTLDLVVNSLKAAVGNAAFVVLILNILADIATGYAKNALYHTADSSAGIKGLIKHSTVIFVSLLIALAVALLGNAYITAVGNIIISLFSFEYLKSVAENFGVMGFKYPKILASKVEKEIEEKTKLKEEAEELKNNRGV